MEGLSGITSVSELLGRIRKGLVPRSVRLFAARGLLPVSREELIRILVLLAAEGDEEIGSAARETLDGFPPERCRSVLENTEIDAVEIDLLAKFVREEMLWEAVVKDPRTADETLRWLARTAPARTQDAIVTNQRRLMSCLELVEDLRANPEADATVLRRLKEFEEEFIEKACAWADEESEEVEPEVEQGPSIDEELRALVALGMQIQVVEQAPLPELDEEELADSGIDMAFLRIARMNTYQRIMCALKGTREERFILVRDRNLLVVRAVMMSPRLTDHEIEAIAGMRGANDAALRAIAGKPAWLRRYTILRNLVFNPKTPPGASRPLVARLSDRDLGALTRDRNVPELVRKFAKEVRSARR